MHVSFSAGGAPGQVLDSLIAQGKQAAAKHPEGQAAIVTVRDYACAKVREAEADGATSVSVVFQINVSLTASKPTPAPVAEEED